MRKAGWVLLYMALLAVPAGAVNMSFTTVFSVPMASFNIVQTTSSDPVTLCPENGLKYDEDGKVTGTDGCDGIVNLGFNQTDPNATGSSSLSAEGTVNVYKPIDIYGFHMKNNTTLSVGREDSHTAWQMNSLKIGQGADVTVSSLIASYIKAPSNIEKLKITAGTLIAKKNIYVKTLELENDIQIGSEEQGNYNFKEYGGPAGATATWEQVSSLGNKYCLKIKND